MHAMRALLRLGQFLSPAHNDCWNNMQYNNGVQVKNDKGLGLGGCKLTLAVVAWYTSCLRLSCDDCAVVAC